MTAAAASPAENKPWLGEDGFVNYPIKGVRLVPPVGGTNETDQRIRDFEAAYMAARGVNSREAASQSSGGFVVSNRTLLIFLAVILVLVGIQAGWFQNMDLAPVFQAKSGETDNRGVCEKVPTVDREGNPTFILSC